MFLNTDLDTLYKANSIFNKREFAAQWMGLEFVFVATIPKQIRPFCTVNSLKHYNSRNTDAIGAFQTPMGGKILLFLLPLTETDLPPGFIQTGITRVKWCLDVKQMFLFPLPGPSKEQKLHKMYI